MTPDLATEVERATENGRMALRNFDRAEAAEAERESLRGAFIRALEKKDRWQKESHRLAHQVADLEAALERVVWLIDGQTIASRPLLDSIADFARSALAAARSRDPQEPTP